jgi:hypothetical protein
MENIGKKSSVPNSQKKRKPSRYAQNMHDDVDTINYDEFDEDDNASDDKDQLPTNLFEHENHQELGTCETKRQSMTNFDFVQQRLSSSKDPNSLIE